MFKGRYQRVFIKVILPLIAFTVSWGVASPTLNVAGEAHASPTQATMRHSFLLGLRAPELRNLEGVTALKERVRKRLRAAHLLDYTLELERSRSELKVEVVTSMPRVQLEALLLSKGELRVVPAVKHAELLAGLRGTLPDGVFLGDDLNPEGADDLFLHSENRDVLEMFAAKLVLVGYRIHVGPALQGDSVTGFRTYLVSEGAPVLGSEGLQEVSIQAYTFPNYYFVRAFWSDTPLAGDKVGVSGIARLQSVTSAATSGGRVLVVVDDRVVSVVAVRKEIADGRLVVRLPPAAPEVQRRVATNLAGRIASGPHPCDVVVVKSSTERR